MKAHGRGAVIAIVVLVLLAAVGYPGYAGTAVYQQLASGRQELLRPSSPPIRPNFESWRTSSGRLSGTSVPPAGEPARTQRCGWRAGSLPQDATSTRPRTWRPLGPI